MSNLYSPTYLKSLCDQYDLRPSKKYGQNYLISTKPILEMVEAGELTKDDVVVEIGPGFGVLTLAVASLVKRMIAFEIERKLEDYWKEKQHGHPNLEIIWGNVLNQFDSTSLPKGYKVLANLPYQITSHAIRTLLETQNPPERIIVMVQKEVAERIVAKPGDMSLLAVSVQYFGSPRIVTKVPKGSFWPAPKVDSAVLAIETITSSEGTDQFFAIAKAGFHNKRKQLWKNLSTALSLDKDRVKAILNDACGSDTVRAQELSIEQWREVVKRLS